MPRWEHCNKCDKAYNPNNYTPEERLLQAIFGEHLCPHCLKYKDAQICTHCNREVLAPVYYNEEPYHSKCLAEVLGQ